MIDILEKSKCSGCTACQKLCPKNCITMQADKEGFLYPKVDKEKCIECKVCINACPVINKKVPESILNTFGATNKDEGVRKQSSSGGIFTFLSERVLEKGGVVFGASFSADYKSVKHIAVQNKLDLNKLRGSKYLQSEMGDSFSLAKEYLEKKIPVLFSGTPCQVGGLKAYLQKDYENLLTIDLVCHGAPSPMVWKEYLIDKEKEYGASTSGVNFRNKDSGWKGYSVSISFSNGKLYQTPFPQNAYMKGFLNNLYLRPSCYDCAFKGEKRISDITLADFWGANKTYPSLDDDKGLSLIVVHTEKGMGYLNETAEKLNIQKVNLSVGQSGNPSMTDSAVKNEKRDEFFKDLENKGYKKVANKYLEEGFVGKSKKLINKIIKKIKG